jgi:hypothetical protein
VLLGICEDIRDLAVECGHRADVLTWGGVRRRSLRRTCNFTSGLITLLASGAAGAIAANLITDVVLKSISAAAVLFAGLMSLVTTHFLDDNETEKMFEGAAKLRGVQWDAETDLATPEFIELREEAHKRKFAKRGASEQATPTEAPDERDKQFRAGAQLAYSKLSELKRRRVAAVEYENYFVQIRDSHIQDYKRKPAW